MSPSAQRRRTLQKRMTYSLPRVDSKRNDAHAATEYATARAAGIVNTK